jgi:hypothetical protein
MCKKEEIGNELEIDSDESFLALEEISKPINPFRGFYDNFELINRENEFEYTRTDWLLLLSECERVLVEERKKRNDSETIRESFLALNSDLEEICGINYVIKSLHRSIEFGNYTNEILSHFEIGEILKKANREISELLNSANDKTDNLAYDFNITLNESKEDKKDLLG